MNGRQEILKRLKKERIPEELLQTPPTTDMGDYALPCFTLAKERKKSPQDIAKDLERIIKPTKIIEKIQANGPYLNFYLNKTIYNKEIIESKKEKKKRKEIITIDFSSPNIMKPFSIAHLRSTMIGNGLANILEHEGYKVIRINHLGDWGTQFGKMMYAFKTWGKRKELEKSPIKYMLNLYVKFHEEAEKNSSLEDKGREWFAKLEKGDKEARVLWKEFRDLSLKEYNKIYHRLNVRFDYFYGEAFYEPYLQSTLDVLEKKGLSERSEGALIVNLDKFNMAPCILQKTDGSSIYATRDLTAAIHRAKEYKFNKNIYLTDLRQSLHFQQFFKVLELAGFSWAKDCKHLGFGLIKFDEGVIVSTRKGQIVFLEEVLDKSVEAVEKIIEEKNPCLKNKKKIAEQVGIGAIIFWDLSHDWVRDLPFSWEKVLDFTGETGPYVQYTYARSSSILRKAKTTRKGEQYEKLTSPSERELLKQIALFEGYIQKAAKEYKPSILAKYLISLCQCFNDFYEKCPCLTEPDQGLAAARLKVVTKTKEILKQGLSLLGIDAPEEM